MKTLGGSVTGVVRTAIWSLVPIAGCVEDDEDDAAGESSAMADDELSDDDGEMEAAACWDREDEDSGYYSLPSGDGWRRAFTCDLPKICDTLRLDFQGLAAEQVAEETATARCILEALRDGTPAVHVASRSEEDGQFFDQVRYHVLPGGVVGSWSWADDLVTGEREAYRATRGAEYFDACLAETELEPLVDCVAFGDGEAFPALDDAACLGEPTCTE